MRDAAVFDLSKKYGPVAIQAVLAALTVRDGEGANLKVRSSGRQGSHGRDAPAAVEVLSADGIESVAILADC